MSAVIKFTKMHGLGNDFVVIDAIRQNIQLTPAQIRSIANRQRGIGCDQILLIEKTTDPRFDFFYRIFNADGTEVEQCGNGARCLAKFVSDEKITSKKQLRVKTIASEIIVHLKDNNMVEVNMGVPTAVRSVLFPDDLYNSEATGVTLSLGNPHVVFVVKDIHHALVDELGQFYNHHHYFPQGVNVGFMQAVDRENIHLRVYERGVGETQACGSGACAAVVAGVEQNLLNHCVAVQLSGGQLSIQWRGGNTPVMMTGPAERVFEGEIII